MALRIAREKRRAKCEDGGFLQEWLRSPRRIGAVSPSSKALGGLMASFVPLEGDGVVLELGPGTGAVTACLLDHGVPADQLVCLEYAPHFCAHLEARFAGLSVLQGDAYRPGGSLSRLVGDRPIAAVVSSLPLMARPEHERADVLDRYLGLLAPGRPLIQFTYALTVPVRPERIGAKAYVSPWVTRNLPPARVVVYRRPQARDLRQSLA